MKTGMVRKLIVIKKPRSGKIPDRPINFPPLDNLHLELLEIKKKLKKGLPLIPVKKVKPRPIVEKPPPPPVVKTTKKPKEIEITVVDDEDDLHQALGEDNASDVSMNDELHSLAASVQGTHTTVSDIGAVEDLDEEPQDEEEDEEDDPYAGLTPEEREEREKEELLWEFKLLKRKYKNASIPDFNEHSDLQLMRKTRDRTVKEIYLDRAVVNYKKYLFYAFMAMEFVCTSWTNFDIAGFTQAQSKMFDDYDTLLVELGEKSYTQWGMNIPVEFRLLGLVLFNAGAFYIAKNTLGPNSQFAEMFNIITGQPPAKKSEPTQVKKKMKGPSIKVEDITMDDE